MRKIDVYGSSDCIWCSRTKTLLAERNIPFDYHNVDYSHERSEMLSRMPPSRLKPTVPQIFIEEKHIGGFSNLARLDAEGALQQMIAGE